ncbi:hypothetical protein C7477_10411 [Phyllobacterium leguminum]|uniref:Uncharacterized protein n=2 Tax=Phyllobacterium leguminum TaxID=314237 RepID=A0A318TD76_9HYPH|nr:hypothetical protein C7477_10411 [Phyllobacterium leguminum]
MKTFLLTVAALALNASVAFAENPYFEDTSDGPDYPTAQTDADTTVEPATDYTATSDIGVSTPSLSDNPNEYIQAPVGNPAARRFSDASPRNGQN